MTQAPDRLPIAPERFRLSERARWLLAVLLIALLALGRLWWLPAHASLNVNEGWNAGHAMRAFGSGPLYPDPESLIGNNYPPLSFLLVGGLGQLIGDHIIAGRLLSLLAQIASGAAVYAMLARLVPDRRWAAAGAILFGAFSVTLLRPYLAMNDPQWLGQAMMAWALVLLVPRAGERLALVPVIAAVTLVVAGGLVKHNLVAVPVAATLWLWIADRRAFWTWATAGAVLAGAACAALFTIWGTFVFSDVLAPARSYSGLRMAAHGAPLLLAVLPGLLAARPLLGRWRDDRRLLLPILLLAVAIFTAVLQRSGDGVDINATFETIVALAIAVSAGCALRGQDALRWYGLAALPALMLVPVAALADIHELAGRDAAVRHWQPFIARVAATPGKVACDDQAVCYWAGRQSALDFFALKQRLLKRDLPQLQTALAAHGIALIAMRSENRGWHENRLIPAIRAHYRSVYRADGYEMLVPR